jgi:hypothetical protein
MQLPRYAEAVQYRAPHAQDIVFELKNNGPREIIWLGAHASRIGNLEDAEEEQQLALDDVVENYEEILINNDDEQEVASDDFEVGFDDSENFETEETFENQEDEEYVDVDSLEVAESYEQEFNYDLAGPSINVLLVSSVPSLTRIFRHQMPSTPITEWLLCRLTRTRPSSTSTLAASLAAG